MIKTANLKSGALLSAIVSVYGGLMFTSDAVAVDVRPAAGPLVLASTDAAGKIKTGLTSPCAVSADGTLVAFNSTASNFVSGDTNNSNDVFLKNVRTGAIKRVSTTSSGGQITTGAVCQGMTPDGSSIVLSAKTSPSSADTHFVAGTEPALFVKNVPSDTLLRISPPLAALPTTSDYVFRSISDDGDTVAFVTTPSSTYVGVYNIIPNGPARTLVADVATGQLTDLTSAITLDIAGFPIMASSSLVLSPDGSLLAFDSRADHPAAGDTNGKSDVFVLDRSTGALSLASTDGFGRQNIFVEGTFGGKPGFKAAGFVGDSLALYVPPESSLGQEGLYLKHLGDGSIVLALPAEAGIRATGAAVPVSFSGDGAKLAFTRRGAQDTAIVHDVHSGQEQSVAVSANGVVGNNASRFPMLSQDGGDVLFQSNATNLNRVARGGTFELYLKTLTP